MTNRILVSIALLLVGYIAGAVSSDALAGKAAPLLYVVDFMKVDPRMSTEYEQLERETWKALHEERIKRGLMRAWSLYAVRYPLGSERPYDYVTVNVFDSFEDAERDATALFEAVHPDLAREDVLDDTYAARDLVRGEIWYRLDHAGD